MFRSQVRRAISVASLITLAAIISAAAATASTITVFSNFSGTPSFNQSNSWVVAGATIGVLVQGMPFTASSTADLSDAVLALGNSFGADGPLAVYLESNNSGQPGSILATLTQQGQIPMGSAGLVTFDYSGATVGLTSGTPYWLVAVETVSNGAADWFYSNNDLNRNVAQNVSGSATGPWTIVSGVPVAAFQVDGKGAPSVVPEPASLQLLALGTLFGLGVLWMDRRRRVKLRV